ncbi:MAG: hypothetical protein EAZ81_10685 [Verrucomicrobia bacterium]|nr:MAG: hypothetical protein EAZ81_10685 [Verrucomicrobiota bacterium]
MGWEAGTPPPRGGNGNVECWSHTKARRHEGGKMEGFLKAGRRDASATGGMDFEGPGAWKDAATEGHWILCLMSYVFRSINAFSSG